MTPYLSTIPRAPVHPEDHLSSRNQEWMLRCWHKLVESVDFPWLLYKRDRWLNRQEIDSKFQDRVGDTWKKIVVKNPWLAILFHFFVIQGFFFSISIYDSHQYE